MISLMRKLALFSVPRSGSSWLGEIINSVPSVIYKFQPNFAYSFPYELTETTTKVEIETFYKHLLECDDEFVNGRLTISGKSRSLSFEKNNLQTIFFKETHYLNIIENLIQNSDTKVIGLVRSPFAVINSWLNIPKEFNPDWSVKDQWLNAELKNEQKPTHFFGYNQWKRACFLFLDFKLKYPNQFILINYNDLLTETFQTVSDLFSFGDLPYTKQTENFLKNSTEHEGLDDYSVFKKKKDDYEWRHKLPHFIEHAIKTDSKFHKLNKIFKWI